MSSQGLLSKYLENKTFTALGGEKGIKRKNYYKEIILNLQFQSLIEDFEQIFYSLTPKILNQSLFQVLDLEKEKQQLSLI